MTNPWFPLPPGRVLVYAGARDGAKAREYLTVTNQVQVVNGVRCRVLLDRLYLNGYLAETTRDYYTQDRDGSVWYFGEDTVQLDAVGHLVTSDGTWRAGMYGAKPGIFMPADPAVGDQYRQEYYPGQAEDHFRVLDLSSAVTVPYRSFDRALHTREWSPLEPGVASDKYYVKGIGTVLEKDVRGGDEMLALVAIRTN